jgi:hypothetical protein
MEQSCWSNHISPAPFRLPQSLSCSLRNLLWREEIGSRHPGRKPHRRAVTGDGVEIDPIIPSRLAAVFQRDLSRQGWKTTDRMQIIELTKSCPNPVPPGAFPCLFRGFRGARAKFDNRLISD